MPATLPAAPRVEWEVPLVGAGLGGIAATDKAVVFGDRDQDDFQDVFRCVDARTGESLWTAQAIAIGKLDYGNSPRATPLIAGERVFLFGAFGDLLCVELSTGKTVWQRNLRKDFAVRAEMPWGFCGSPLLADGKLIVSPGGEEASVVALDPRDGAAVWQAKGAVAGHGSFIADRFGGRLQIVGHDADSLGGWDVATGTRLWKLTPSAKGDFNVATPVAYRGQLIVATENNGTRQYRFRDDGTIDPEPVAVNRRLTPNMSTPVVVGDRLFCVHRFLFCLDLRSGLREIQRSRDPAYGDYAALIADERHVLIAGQGELLLVDGQADPPRVVSRSRVFPEQVDIYSHPALVGSRLYIRGETALKCLVLE